MRFGFSTLGKPEASLKGIKALALGRGLDFVELRTLGGTVDLPGYFRSRESEDAGPPFTVRVLGTSFCLVNFAADDLPKFVEMAQLAERLGSPYLRVFGGGQWPEEPGAAAYDHAAKTVGDLRRELQRLGLKVKLLLETHDAFSSSRNCQALNQRLAEPLEILWDSYLTWRAAGESPAETWRQLGPLIRHIHYKDGVSRVGARDGYDYVVPGHGEFPTAALLELLAEKRFDEGLSLEWEKHWHPELVDLETALDGFARVIESYRSVQGR